MGNHRKMAQKEWFCDKQDVLLLVLIPLHCPSFHIYHNDTSINIHKRMEKFLFFSGFTYLASHQFARSFLMPVHMSMCKPTM